MGFTLVEYNYVNKNASKKEMFSNKKIISCFPCFLAKQVLNNDDIVFSLRGIVYMMT